MSPSDTPARSFRTASALLDAALAYAALGWRVLPLHGINREGACSCAKGDDCTSAGKHPRLKEWKTLATTDAEQLQAWWEQWPEANLGVATGRGSGLIVLDFDMDTDATQQIAALLPPTVIAQTGKGTHYYFALPPDRTLGNSRGTLPAGIDVRGEGGFAVLPPSRHASGRRYIWLRDPEKEPVAPLPAAVLERLARQRPPVDGEHQRPPLGHPGSYWLQRALEQVQSGEGRNETGFWLSCQLRDDGVSHDLARDLLREYAAAVCDLGPHEYTEAEALASLEQAFTQTPRAPAVDTGGQALEPVLTLGDELPDAPAAAQLLVLPTHYGITPSATLQRKRVRDDEGAWTWKWGPFAYAPVVITGILHDIETGAESLRLAWKRGEQWREAIVPRKMALSAHELLALADQGFPVDSTTAQAMSKYLSAFEAINYAHLPKERVSHHLGWQGTRQEFGFLWGTEHLALPETETVTFRGADEGDTQVAGGFHRRGTLAGWLEAVEMVGYFPKVLFGFYAAFVPPLLPLLDCDSFVVDYSGRTSTGKTTALRVAASVVGCPDESRRSAAIATWNTTTVAAERRCGLLSGLPVLFDDTRKAKRRETVADVVYQFSGGQGRGRGTLAGLGQTATFRSVLLSSGEEAAVDFTTAAGVRGRVISLRGLPFVSDAVGNVARDLNQDLRAHYGHAFPLFVAWVVAHHADWSSWRAEYQEQVRALMADAPNNVAERLAAYVAAVLRTVGLVHRAFADAGDRLPWTAQHAREQLLAEWDDLAPALGGADVDVRALQAIRSWAAANPQRFWGRHPVSSYTRDPQAPAQGWLGRWDAGDNWTSIAFHPEALRRYLLEREFRPDEVLPALKERIDDDGQPWLTYRNVRWGKGTPFEAQDKMFVVTRAAFEAAAPPH